MEEIQAIDELGRWEDAIIKEKNGDTFLVSFRGWSSQYDIWTEKERIRPRIDPKGYISGK
jgi:hypothetical protein